MIASVETVVAAVTGICLYHESVGTLSLLGIVLVIVSIVVMNIGGGRKGSVNSDILVRKTNTTVSKHLDSPQKYVNNF